MKDKDKVILAIIAIIILVILIILLSIKLVKKHITIPTMQSDSEQKIENSKENHIVQEKVNNINTNDIENNTIQNNIIQNTIQNNSANTGNVNTEEERNEQKAINIAKQNWGEDDTVSFSLDTVDDKGRYIICVRDKQTTRALYWYTIDVESGTVTIE